MRKIAILLILEKQADLRPALPHNAPSCSLAYSPEFPMINPAPSVIPQYSFESGFTLFRSYI